MALSSDLQILKMRAATETDPARQSEASQAYVAALEAQLTKSDAPAPAAAPDAQLARVCACDSITLYSSC